MNAIATAEQDDGTYVEIWPTQPEPVDVEDSVDAAMPPGSFYAAPTPGALYLDHRAKLTGRDTYDAAIEVVGFVSNDDAGGATAVLYRNLKDGTHHVLSLEKFLEPVEALFADGWRTVTRFVLIAGGVTHG